MKSALAALARWLANPRVRRLAWQDAAVFATAFVGTGIFATNHLTVAALVAALATAAKVSLRTLFPVPPSTQAVIDAVQQHLSTLPPAVSNVTVTVPGVPAAPKAVKAVPAQPKPPAAPPAA